MTKRWLDAVFRRNKQRLRHEVIPGMVCANCLVNRVVNLTKLMIIIALISLLLVFKFLTTLIVLIKLKKVNRLAITVFSLETFAREFIIVRGLIKGCNPKIYLTLLAERRIEPLAFPELFARIPTGMYKKVICHCNVLGS